MLHTHSQGAGAPRSLPMDGTLVNVNDQIVHLELFSFSLVLFLGQVVNIVSVISDGTTNHLCVSPTS